ncbi:MAG: hypothetical protein U0L26_12350 [Cellulosilyticum sp.]|nr:hypothetical protein [Cellulosilyticum sp.]
MDLEQGTITIKESLKRSRAYSDDGSFTVKDVVKEPKTKKGIRLIYIPDILIVKQSTTYLPSNILQT